MSLLSPRQIARRVILSRSARYQRALTHGESRSNATRVLHVVLLLTVIHQLLSSKFIRMPMPGSSSSMLYSLHEYLGIGSLGVVLVFWMWTLIRHGETRLGRLIPWFSPLRVGDVLLDLRAHVQMMVRIARGGEPHHGGNGAVASAVHGLGLIVLTAMASTGTVFFYAQGSPLAHQALALHRLLANLMWIYLIGHAGLAALHHLLGSDIVLRMFWIRRGITVTTPPPRIASDGAAQMRETATGR